MSKGSEAVKQWRQRTKQRMVDAFGGKCCGCGYSKCINALEFHHVDPSEKDFQLGGIRSNPKSWAKCVAELKKCVMFCANCHREVHDGSRDIPSDARKFDPVFEVYREAPKRGECPICQKAMPITNKTCSHACAASMSGSANWGNYNLFELKKTMNDSEIGRLIGVSSAGVYRRWQKLMANSQNCRTCGELTLNEFYCSESCVHKSRERISISTDELWEKFKLNGMNYTLTAKEHGISDVAVRKRFKRAGKI